MKHDEMSAGRLTRRRNRFTVLAITILALSGTWVANLFAANAKLVVDAPLKSKPDFNAQQIGSLKQGDPVVVLQRQRGWYQVQAGEQPNGWLTLLQLKLDRDKPIDSPSDLKRLVGLRQGHSDITATTGVRGIGEKDIKNAKADFEALTKAGQYYVKPDDAAKFAKQAKLKSIKIAYPEKAHD